MQSCSYAGDILRVDLTTRKIAKEPTVAYAKRFLGGRGINTWILYRETKPWTTPYEPANRLIFGIGPLVGTLAPCATRLTVNSKNAFTGGFGSGSCCGYFANEMKYAGYDGMILQGRSNRPAYLGIQDDDVKLKDASSVWGKTTWETEDLIKDEIGDKDVQVATIGPAGENLVRSACIITNKSRAAGRCGFGAVMGSKNLKAIAVRGTGSVQVADPERFMEVVNEMWDRVSKSGAAKNLGKYGTNFLMPNDRSLMPMRNFQDGFMEPKRLEKVSTQVLYDNYIERRIGYYADPISCSHFYRVKEGPYAGTATEGIEGSGIWDFACTFDIDYAPAIIRAYSVCSQLGLDIDSTSSTLGWAFELYQRGIINKGDTDGYALEWGRYDILLEFLRRIAFREGFGDILAEGCMRASQIMGRGSEKYAIQVKGQDLKEPLRSCKGWALGVTVDTRGGGHCAAAPWAEYGDIDPDVSEKIWGVRRASEPTTYDQKEIMVAYYERLNKMLDSLGICIFTSNISGTDLLGPEDYAKMLSAAVGFEVTGREFMQVGERIHNVEKAYNVLHANFGRRDDYPPERMMNEPVKSGPLKGQRLDKNQWDKLLDRYYRLHGWNVETGLQSRECLIKLDLEEVATDLERASRISEGAQ